MDSDDAVELLYTCSGIPVASDDVAAKHLVEALGFLPLALDQAGAYISGQCLSFNEYMELYGESRGHLLRHKPPKAVWCYEETVFTTWEISFAAVSKTDTLATKLLDVAAFFHSDDVPFALLCPLTQNLRPGQRLFLGDFLDFVETRLDYSQIIGSMCNELRVSKISVKQAIGRLESLSLVRRKKESQSILIHPLVHFWLRERQSDSQRFENSRVAICLVLYALINAYDLSQFRDAEAIYPYLFICLEQVYETPRLMSPTELQKLGACIIAVDSWVPFSIDPSTLRRADCFYDFISNKRAEAAWVIPEAMLAMRRALRLKSMGHRKKTSEHCSKFLETFEQHSQFDKMYAACIARIAAPCCYRMGDYDGAEKVYGYIDDSLDSTGTMLARKQLVLGAIKIDRGLPLDAEALLSACASELVRGIGHEHFLLRGRLREAEETVLQQLNARLEQFDMSKIEFTFSDYELVEVYERILRKQRRYKEGRVLLARLLTNARSKAAKPEQALAELSLALTELDEKTWLYEPSSPVESQNEGRGIEIEALIADAYVAYEAAAVAYELEWNRGTWVFKHFHATMDEYRQRLESGITGVGTATAEDWFETD
ncbi:hypothetical protein GGS24DRAFT_495296 [Hypoxylon argillaceum]|nr:hypothetical protein GGS24DRAFT_495296 [Hypoxylon argillaceum]